MNQFEDDLFLELCNKEFNLKMSAREVGNKILCANCYGSGFMYISPICDYDGIDKKCYHCNATGYIENIPNNKSQVLFGPKLPKPIFNNCLELIGYDK